MAEALAHDMHRNVGEQQDGPVRVPEIVKPDHRERVRANSQDLICASSAASPTTATARWAPLQDPRNPVRENGMIPAPPG